MFKNFFHLNAKDVVAVLNEETGALVTGSVVQVKWNNVLVEFPENGDPGKGVAILEQLFSRKTGVGTKKTPWRLAPTEALFYGGITVNGVVCPSCGDRIFSRARHDFRRCSCGEVFVDGGFSYLRVGYTETPPEQVAWQINPRITKAMLYEDWKAGTDKYGKVPKP